MVLELRFNNSLPFYFVFNYSNLQNYLNSELMNNSLELFSNWIHE